MTKLKDKNTVKRFNRITIGLASPESILAENLKRLTIVLSNQKEMVFSVQKFLDQLKTMNVFVENTRE